MIGLIPLSTAVIPLSTRWGCIEFATLSVDPLVIRQEWDKGQVTNPNCNGIDNNNYVTQPTLASNIQDFCSKSAQQNVANSQIT